MKTIIQNRRGLLGIPVKKRQEILLRAAKAANKEQRALEAKYLKLLAQK